MQFNQTNRNEGGVLNLSVVKADEIKETIERLLGQMAAIDQRIEVAIDVMGSIPVDEATIAAGLWQGDMIPRAINGLEEARRIIGQQKVD